MIFLLCNFQFLSHFSILYPFQNLRRILSLIATQVKVEEDNGNLFRKIVYLPFSKSNHNIKNFLFQEIVLMRELKVVTNNCLQQLSKLNS